LNLKALRGPLSEYDPLHRENEDDAIWGDDHATLNKRELIKLRSKNTYRFNTLYQGEPSVAEGNIVKQDDIPRTPLDFIPKVHNLTLSIDAASGITSTCDNTTLTVGGTTEEDKPIVIQQNSGNWDIIKLRTKIREINKSYSFDSVVIEASSNGLVLLPEITADPMSYGFEAHCNIIKASPQLYGSKARRLESVLDLVKMTLFCNFEEYELFKAELIAFPYGTKDDRVDSYSWLLWHLRPFCKEAENDLKAEYTKIAIEAFKVPLIDSKISDLIAKPVWEKDYSFARYGQPIR
jgi:phage terminase large subunit-like protein